MTDRRLDLKHAVDAIWLGPAYRHDLGDVDELCESIRAVGLLHPIVISPEGMLISGRRRLEAVKRLGWRRVPVWIAAHASDRASIILAVHHENTLRKELTPLEAATLYTALEAVRTEEAEAARRQAASCLRAATGRGGRSRDRAAETSEQLLALERIVNDAATPRWLRAEAKRAIADLSRAPRATAAPRSKPA